MLPRELLEAKLYEAIWLARGEVNARRSYIIIRLEGNYMRL